ncbi:MAG: ABC transporter permease [Gemmobacter sp.]
MTAAPSLIAGLRRNPISLAVALLIVLIVVNALLQRNFFKPGILVSNLTTFLPLMMIAVGQAFVVKGGSIDLSLGAIVSLVNVVVVVVAERTGGTGGMVLGMACGLAAGLACGVVNGVLIAVFRLQAIVTTFATSIVIGGLALKVLPQAGGALPATYYITYGGWVGGVLPFVLIVLGVLVGAIAWAARTAFHTHLTAVGANRQGAFQTGLPVARIRITAHVIAGGMAAVAALCILGVTGAGDPLMGQAFTLGSVSAVVLGGIALSGGWGHILGAVLGGAILGFINNIIFFANIPYQFQSIVQGVIILLALAAGIFVSRKPG